MPGKLLIANVGNTHVRLVTVVGGRVAADRRVPTGEAAGEATDADRIALVSVVPAVADALEAAWGERVTRVAVTMPTAYGPGMGADRLVNALALWKGFGPGIAIDAGTATTLTVVDGTGTIRGGAILPVLTTARDSLWKGTAQLPAVPLAVPPHAVGTSTLESLQSGLVLGHVGALKHLVASMQAEVPDAVNVVVTGGWGGLLANLLQVESAPDLTIEGAGWALLSAGS